MIQDSIYCNSFKVINQMTFSQRAENALIDYLHVYIQTMNFDLAKYIGLVAYKPREV